MAFSKKYAGLPDLDLAPDVYETPDLTDEASTLPTTTARTIFDTDDEVGSDSDIDRHGINADEARAHFLGATVDARDVNFSDSIAVKRKAYRNRNRRRRRGDGGSGYAGDASDSEEETVERKLARLRREVEELKDDLAARNADANQSGADVAMDDGVLELSRALDNLHASTRGSGEPQSAATTLSRRLESRSLADPKKESDNSTTNAKMPSTSTGILTHAAAFDSRLALVEAAMGISSSSNPLIIDTISKSALHPVLPTLDLLTSRLSTLTSILVGPAPGSAAQAPGSAPPLTTPHLEALASRVRKLTADAEALEVARKRANDAAKARIAASAVDDDPVASSQDPATDPAAAQRDEQASKIQALYATLPAIQSLHPILPGVLERLRSLRAIHAGAAQAAESLDAVERRQAEMTKEIEQWREGLRVVEEKMSQSEAAMKSNIEVVEPWVRDLETRLDRLENNAGNDDIS